MAIHLHSAIAPFEVMKEEAKTIAMSAARQYIHKNETFKGRPKLKEFYMSRGDAPGSSYNIRLSMTNQGETVEPVQFHLVMSKEEILYSYLRRLEDEIDSVRSSSHTHDWR